MARLIYGQNHPEKYEIYAPRRFSLLFWIGPRAYRYASGKWSIKQIVGHITDHERIKMFRAFQLSRKEEVQLWGYDQNSLVNNSRFDELTLPQLLTDYCNVREASQSFIDTLSEDQFIIKGWARQHEVSLEDFLKSIIGHELHHLNIIKERYL